MQLPAEDVQHTTQYLKERYYRQTRQGVTEVLALSHHDLRKYGRLVVTLLRHERLAGKGPKVCRIPPSGYLPMDEVYRLTGGPVGVLHQLVTLDLDEDGRHRFVMQHTGGKTFIAATRKHSAGTCSGRP